MKKKYWVSMVLLFVLGVAPLLYAQDTVAYLHEWTDVPLGTVKYLTQTKVSGNQTPYVEEQKIEIDEHLKNGQSKIVRYRKLDGEWKKVKTVRAGGKTPIDAGLSLIKTSDETVTIGAKKIACKKEVYEKKDTDGTITRVMCWKTDTVDFPVSVMPQWGGGYGFQLDANVIKAYVERIDLKETNCSVEVTIEKIDDPVKVGTDTFESLVQKQVWARQSKMLPKKRITNTQTRWLSKDVPGLVVKSVTEKIVGRTVNTVTDEITGFTLGDGGS